MRDFLMTLHALLPVLLAIIVLVLVALILDARGNGGDW